MTDIPVYPLVQDWPVWLLIAAMFGAAAVALIQAADVAWHTKVDPWEDK
jgi:hypothetical protein